MKILFLVLMLLTLMMACASVGTDKSDPKFSYGGSYRIRVISENVK